MTDDRDAGATAGESPARRDADAGAPVIIGTTADGQPLEGVTLSEEQRRRRRSRSIAIALVLGALCVLFYVVTIVKLGPAVLIRPL